MCLFVLQIASYPRTIASSVRRPDDKRKQKRKERLERKEQEKEAKREELKRMKNLKKKEIMEKLDKLATITGNPVESLGLSLDDLEEDFDPTEYDAKMAALFNEEYYAAGGEEEEKPVFPEMEGDGEVKKMSFVFYFMYVVVLFQMSWWTGIHGNQLVLVKGVEMSRTVRTQTSM